jgi:hypothetical protein
MRVPPIAGRPALVSRRFHALLAVLVLALLCPACSSGRKAVNAVRGQILVDGKPAAQAQVLFHPAAKDAEQLQPAGQTDDQGYFDLTTYAKGDGAPEGDYTVTVTWFRVFRNGDEVSSRNVLPRRYAVPESSQLKVTVNKGKNDLSALQLTSR